MDSHSAPHPPASFVRRYLFSKDHKVIGLQYLVTSIFFLLFGLTLVSIMRHQLAYPGQPIPGMHTLFPRAFPGGTMLPETYLQLGSMHGTIMIFLGIVPLGVGAFGNYILPLMIGAEDMAFPTLNMLSYWIYLLGGLVMLSGFFLPGGAPQSGWTSYPPLAVINPASQDFWLLGMVFLITSSLLGSINFIVTILKLRAPGLTLGRLPIFVWAQFVTATLLLLAFPVLEAGAILELMDRVAGTSFFIPSGLVVSGTPLARSGGGQPLLWQHLFWFLAHPEVYILILPAMGIVGDVLATFMRKPIQGYKIVVGSFIAIGVLSFFVWAHHMFVSGMNPALGKLFAATTVIISIPSVAIVTAYVVSLYGGSIRFTTPMLFALAFLPMFGIGGLTGLPLGLAPLDIYLHDTYYVIGHFHYVVVPGSIFGLLAGFYYWFPKFTGRKMNETLGKLHFWGSILAVNCVFFPMFILGTAGVSRRLYDMTGYAHARALQPINVFISWAVWILFLAQIPFFVNVAWSLWKGEPGGDNPWRSNTLEWTTTSPPPHENFKVVPTVHRGPYDYSLPGSRLGDYAPQTEPAAAAG